MFWSSGYLLWASVGLKQRFCCPNPPSPSHGPPAPIATRSDFVLQLWSFLQSSSHTYSSSHLEFLSSALPSKFLVHFQGTVPISYFLTCPSTPFALGMISNHNISVSKSLWTLNILTIELYSPLTSWCPVFHNHLIHVCCMKDAKERGMPTWLFSPWDLLLLLTISFPLYSSRDSPSPQMPCSILGHMHGRGFVPAPWE